MAIILDDDLVCCRGAGRPRQQGELPGGDRGRDGGLHRLLGLLPPGVELGDEKTSEHIKQDQIRLKEVRMSN